MDIQAQAITYIRAALVNERNEAVNLKDVYHMMHDAWYDDICNTNKCILIEFSKRRDTFVYQIN